MINRRGLFVFQCGSPRCPGPCRDFARHQLYARAKETLSKHCGWICFTLTLVGNRFKTNHEAYRQMGRAWGRFRARLVRKYGQIHYLRRTERHRSGKPHDNVLLANPMIAQACTTPEGRVELHRTLEHHAWESGFGRRLAPEGDSNLLARNLEAVLSYLAKEGTQVPENAPRHYRTFSASRGFLEMARKNTPIPGRPIMLNLEDSQRLLAAGELRLPPPRRRAPERSATPGTGVGTAGARSAPGLNPQTPLGGIIP